MKRQQEEKRGKKTIAACFVLVVEVQHVHCGRCVRRAFECASTELRGCHHTTLCGDEISMPVTFQNRKDHARCPAAHHHACLFRLLLPLFLPHSNFHLTLFLQPLSPSSTLFSSTPSPPLFLSSSLLPPPPTNTRPSMSSGEAGLEKKKAKVVVRFQDGEEGNGKASEHELGHKAGRKGKQRGSKADAPKPGDPKEIQKMREDLPIFAARKQLLDMIKKQQFSIVIGETGSGKTTQLPQYLYEDKLNASPYPQQQQSHHHHQQAPPPPPPHSGPANASDKKRNSNHKDGHRHRQRLKFGAIAITQPRRVAAITVAQRVAWERGEDVGSLVGYAVRFDERTCKGTRIKVSCLSPPHASHTHSLLDTHTLTHSHTRTNPPPSLPHTPIHSQNLTPARTPPCCLLAVPST